MVLSRRKGLVLLGLATALLIAASWTILRSVTELGRARTQAALVRAEAAQLQGLMAQVQEQERYQQDAQAFAALMARTGLDPAQWANRKVQHTAAIVARVQAEKLVGQQIDGRGTQWFAPERFDVAVVSPEAGLFTPAEPADRGFSLEMTGKVFFPLGQP